jgi:IPT/TIG domain
VVLLQLQACFVAHYFLFLTLFFTGTNFGTNSSAVSVVVNGTIPCYEPIPTETQIICNVTEFGQGKDLPISVSVSGQSTDASLFNYEGILAFYFEIF